MKIATFYFHSIFQFLRESQQNAKGLKLVLNCYRTKVWPKSYAEDREWIARDRDFRDIVPSKLEQEQLMALLLFQKSSKLILDENQILRIRMDNQIFQ